MTLNKDICGWSWQFALDAAIPFTTDVIKLDQIRGGVPIVYFILGDWGRCLGCAGDEEMDELICFRVELCRDEFLGVLGVVDYLVI